MNRAPLLELLTSTVNTEEETHPGVQVLLADALEKKQEALSAAAVSEVLQAGAEAERARAEQVHARGGRCGKV